MYKRQVEDTAKKDVPQESTLKDTVPLLESKVSISKVSRADVDVSNFSKASASSTMVSVTPVSYTHLDVYKRQILEMQ